MCVCVCLCVCIKLREVKNQCAMAKRTSQILKNGQDAIIKMGRGARGFG